MLPAPILLATFFSICHAFSAQSGTCDSSNLGAGPSRMSATNRTAANSAFKLGISGNLYKAGNPNTIWINRTSGTIGFRGLLLYVEDAQNTRIGTFTTTANSKHLTCTPAPAAATLTHNANVATNNAFKAEQPFTWNAPNTVNGSITIRAIAYDTAAKHFNIPTPLVVQPDPNATTTTMAPTTTMATTTMSGTTTTMQSTTVTFSGWMVDHWCWTNLNGTALDTGADLRVTPNVHTIHCLLYSNCPGSGYALVEKKCGASKYTIKYDLDATGNSLVQTELRKVVTGSAEYWARNGYAITATGTVDSTKSSRGNTLLRVTSFKRTTMTNFPCTPASAGNATTTSAPGGGMRPDIGVAVVAAILVMLL